MTPNKLEPACIIIKTPLGVHCRVFYARAYIRFGCHGVVLYVSLATRGISFFAGFLFIRRTDEHMRSQFASADITKFGSDLLILISYVLTCHAPIVRQLINFTFYYV